LTQFTGNSNTYSPYWYGAYNGGVRKGKFGPAPQTLEENGVESTIFGKPLSGVTYSDVADFCSLQKKEGINLDYKRDLSSSKPIIKTIAAFANTRGGYIIVGVDDEDDKPKAPFIGMEYQDSLPLTITNMLVDNLYPYFAPQIHICEPVDGKTFVIIHVPESPEAPHWLFNRSELYIRRADRSSSTSWERFATEQEWEYLRNKRKKSVDLREYSLRQLDQVFCQENLKDLRSHQPPLPADRLKVQWEGLLQVKLMPLFPAEPIVKVRELNDLLMGGAINNIHRGSFPHPGENKVFQTGAYRYVNRHGGDSYGVSNFIGLNTVGDLVAYEYILLALRHGPSIFASHVMELTEAASRFMSNTYGSLGYHGNIGIYIIFKGPAGVLIELPPRFTHNTHANLLGEFKYYDELEVSSLESQEARYNLLLDVIRELFYSFGITFDPTHVLDEILSESSEYSTLIATKIAGLNKN
jgi:Schlafen, AlbA_2